MRISDWSSDVYSSDLFHPRIDLVEPVLGTADKHLDLVLQPFGEHFLQAHDARRVMRIKHIEVQRYAVFKVGEPEQTVHQHMGIDRAAARFKHDADLSVRFVANVGQNRQLLFRDQLSDLFEIGRASCRERGCQYVWYWG